MNTCVYFSYYYIKLTLSPVNSCQYSLKCFLAYPTGVTSDMQEQLADTRWFTKSNLNYGHKRREQEHVKLIESWHFIDSLYGHDNAFRHKYHIIHVSA